MVERKKVAGGIASVLIFGVIFFYSHYQSDTVKTEFLEVTNEKSAKYRVYNPANREIYGIKFMMTYRNPDNEIISVDTVSYKQMDGSVFIEPGGETIVSHQVSDKAAMGSAEILAIFTE